jgi:Polyketide cyclase / dehydrase and lipid transport
MPFPAMHITITINRPVDQVYAYAADPENMPQWAAGLAPSIRKAGDIWIIDTPTGEIKVRFAEPNAFGVIDHEVTLPSGETFYNPMRAVPNGDGCEFTFTLYRMPDVTDEAFARDSAAVERDLQQLKSILEASG